MAEQTTTPAAPAPAAAPAPKSGGRKGGAVLALVFGILSFVTWMVSSWVSVVLGVLGLVFGIKSMKGARILAGIGGVLSLIGILLAVWAGNW